MEDHAGTVDFHSHLVPGVDDGARDLDEALAAVGRLAAAGVRDIITTPHLNASTIGNAPELERNAGAVGEAFERLVRAAGVRYSPVRLHLGREIMLDTPAVDLTDPRVRLAGGAFVLVEFPLVQIPPRSADALFALEAKGWHPVVAHPERYHGIHRQYDLLGEWRRIGARLQVNAGSLIGRYGADARRAALELVAMGWADYASSDYHARGEPRVTEAREHLHARGLAEQAELLFDTNPRRLLDGEPPLPVPPGAAVPAWRRLIARLRGAPVGR